MTLVICPNLALDRLLAADRVRLGGITRARELLTQAGGKGANVARATRALGGEAQLVGFAAGCTGRRVVELAGDEGLRLETVATGGETRMSTVVLADDGSVTRLYEVGPRVTAADQRALIELAEARAAAAGEWAVVTGAAPPGAAPEFYAELVAAARRAGYRVLVDATGEQLRGVLLERPDLIKANLSEACAAIGPPDAECADQEPAAGAEAGAETPAETPAAAETPAQTPTPAGAETAAPTRAQLAQEAFELSEALCAAGAQAAALTLGAAGAAGILGGERRQVASPPVETVNPVGSGDCFAAALVLALQRGDEVSSALRLSAAAGAANAESVFTGHIDSARVHQLAALLA